PALRLPLEALSCRSLLESFPCRHLRLQYFNSTLVSTKVILTQYERSILVGLIISAGVIFNFVWALDEEVSLERARTIAVTTMVLFQFFQAWNSRSELQSVFTISPFSNPFLFYSMVAAFLAQIAVVYVPALQWVFRTEALSLGEWARILLVSLTVVIAVEADKAIRRHRRKGK
ncbi:MAG: hypothetical protein FJ115_17760, partial [Deltaproteobacteria bacterium]|nr:hypothetical protein [Deltaproteobacteria bacterium]